MLLPTFSRVVLLTFYVGSLFFVLGRCPPTDSHILIEVRHVAAH